MRCHPFLSGPRFALRILALLIITPAWAEDPVAEYEAIKRSSLKGIESVSVIVLASEADSGCRQVSDEQIQTEVEARLRRAGILIGPGAASYLFVSVASVEALKELLCGFAVSVELQQVVLLARDMRVMTFGMTWHQGGLGVAATSRIQEYLLRMLADIVDNFINAYLEQNPKK
jgi:hypothetical protein